MANCCFIFSVMVASFAAIVVGIYYNQDLPEGLPDDQKFTARLTGVSLDILRFVGHAASLVGIGDSPVENLNHLMDKAAILVQHVESKDDGLDKKDIKIANVPVRVYKPKHAVATKKLTGVVYLHGGGWTIGSLELYDSLTSRLAKEANVVLISVNYRLAPKHTFPTQFMDCYAVVKAVLATGDQYGIDTNRIVVAGDSAGGNLATAVALKLRDENIRLAAQILIYPAMQFVDFSLPSYKKQSSPSLTRLQIAVYWSYYMTGTPNMASSFLANNHSLHLRNTKYFSYIGVEDKEQHKVQRKALDDIPKVVLDGLTDYRASPLMADNLKGLPKTLLITCEHDVLKDDGLLYKARLHGAGVKLTHLNYMTYHAFLTTQSAPFLATEEFHQALRDIVYYLKEL